MPKKTQKNRRCRGAKFSEYRLAKLGRCFARNMTAKEASAKTGFSEPTVNHRFMQLRQRIYDHGIIRMAEPEGGAKDRPARYIFDRKHKGVHGRYAHLYEVEAISRIFATKNIQSVKRFAASDVKDMQAVMKFLNYNKVNDKYDITEMLFDPNKDEAQREKRPFEYADYKSTSTIIVNERNIDPHDAFFRVIWALLLKHPL